MNQIRIYSTNRAELDINGQTVNLAGTDIDDTRTKALEIAELNGYHPELPTIDEPVQEIILPSQQPIPHQPNQAATRNTRLPLIAALTALPVILAVGFTAGYITNTATSKPRVKTNTVTVLKTVPVNENRLASANLAACRIGTNGKGVYCSGSNKFGQLGQPDTQLHQTTLLANEKITALAFGAKNGCAAATSKIWCWGDAASGIVAGKESKHPLPPTEIKLPTSEPIVALTLGADYACAATNTKTICWGGNKYGQITADTDKKILPPTIIKPLDGKQITSLSSSGFTTWATTKDGTRWAWGNNLNQEIPTGATANHVPPTKIN